MASQEQSCTDLDACMAVVGGKLIDSPHSQINGRWPINRVICVEGQTEIFLFGQGGKGEHHLCAGQCGLRHHPWAKVVKAIKQEHPTARNQAVGQQSGALQDEVFN